MSKTPYYRYTLGTLVLAYAPQEWAEDQFFIERSMTYMGLFRSFSTKELTFIKDGAVYLKNLFDTSGTETVCAWQVEVLNTTTYVYDVQFIGEIDFSTYKLTTNYVNGVATYIVKVQVIDNSFVNTVKTRDSENVDLHKLFSISGTAITPFTNEGRSINIPDRTDSYTALLSTGFPYTATRAVGLVVTTREDESINTVNDSSDPTNIEAAFFKCTYETTLSCLVNLSGTITFSSGLGHVIISFKRYNSQGVLKSTTTISDETTSDFPETITYSINTSFNVGLVTINDYVVLEVAITGTPDTPDLTFIITTTNNRKIITSCYFKGYPYHEAFTRIIQALTDGTNPFYSDILGRTDSEVTSYASDGDMSAGVITNGLLLRSFDFTDANVKLNVSLKDLFKSLSAIYPLAFCIETIGGVQKGRIETLRYAFDSDVFLSLDNCINISNEVADDLTFSDINVGYSKSDESYNTVKGINEYNRSAKYATVITRQNNSFSNVAPYRADSNGIVGTRLKNKAVALTEDTQYDDNNFLVSIIHSGWVIKRAEGYTTISGTDNNTDSYNIDYAPARCLLSWGSYLRSCLEKYIQEIDVDAIISFVASEKNSAMYSQKTTESAPVYEGEDIVANSLASPFFENIYITFDCVVTNAMITAINGSTGGKPNYYGLVAFRNNVNEAYQYGWIMKFESRKPDNKGLGSFKLLKCNTTYVTPS